MANGAFTSGAFGGKSSGSSGASHPHGVSGFVHNMLSDVEDTAKGVPTGVVKLFTTNPKVTAENVAKATWADWSPLFHGHPNQWAHQFYNHPLAPLLDVSAFITGGAGAAGRVAKGLDAAGLAGEGGKIAKLADYSRPSELKLTKTDARSGTDLTVEKRLSTNPATKARQLATHKLLNQLEPHLPPVFSYGNRFERVNNRAVQSRRAALQTMIAQAVSAGKKLSGPTAHQYEEQSIRGIWKDSLEFAHKHDPSKPLPADYIAVKGGAHANLKRDLNKSFETELKGLRNKLYMRPAKDGRLTDTQLAKAAKDSEGNIFIVPKHTVRRMGIEGYNSSKTLKMLYKDPTRVWKVLQLGYRPAFFVNNFVGNYFMYAMAHDPIGGFRGYVDALRQVYGEREYKVADTLEKALRKQKGDHINHFFRDQLGNTLADSTLNELGRKSKLAKVAKYSLFGITHAAADSFLRRASINAHLRDEPAVRAMMKEHNLSFDQASARALAADAKTGGVMRRRVSQRTMDVMGDYHTLSPVERRIRDIVPFYTWDRHITRHIGQMLGERPARLAAMAQLGSQGTATNEKIMGDVPKFLRGAIPLSILGLHIDHPGRQAVLQTQGMNPYSTIPDLTNSISRLVSDQGGSPAETIGAQLNPLIEAGVEHLSGHSLLSDKPVSQPEFPVSIPGIGKKVPGGLVGAVLAAPYASMGWNTLLDRVVNGTPQPKSTSKKTFSTAQGQPFLYEKTPLETLLAQLGIPVKQVNNKAAAKQAKSERRRAN